jgi:hypothetical protein
MTIQQTQSSINFSGSILTGTLISVNFDSLQGSNPKALGYFVALWQGNQIMSLDSALSTQNITTTNRAGSAVFSDLNIGNLDYIVGFGVDNEDGKTVCSTITFPAGTPFNEKVEGCLSSLTLISQSTNSLVASFKTPTYNLAKANNNWVALFKGALTANMYKGINVLDSAMVTDNVSEGTSVMNNSSWCNLYIGLWYGN